MLLWRGGYRVLLLPCCCACGRIPWQQPRSILGARFGLSLQEGLPSVDLNAGGRLQMDVDFAKLIHAWGWKSLWKKPALLGCPPCSHKQHWGEVGTGTALFWGLRDGRGEQCDEQSPFQQ